jgi:16S rRNA (guanine1207-N2)-methyltransferase
MKNVVLNGISMSFNTSAGLFSPKSPDAGTMALLSRIVIAPEDKVLDLGCGYGLVGIYAAKIIGGSRITMSDIDPAAVAMARDNAVLNCVPDIRMIQSDGFSLIDDTGYTLILSNPPYQSDFKTAKGFIEKGFNRLAVGGRLMMVTKRREWYKNKLISVFGGVSIDEINGYFVFTAEKRSMNYSR